MRAHCLVAMMSPLHGEGPRFEQLLAKLARMAGIELKIQAHRARYARKCFESPGGPTILILDYYATVV